MADEQRRREPRDEEERESAPDRAETAPRGGVDPDTGRHLGGHELPDAVQDRPEQNAGYDEAVHGAPQGLIDPDDGERRDTDAEIAGDLAASAAEEDPAETERRRRFAQIDDAAANDAAQTVRRRDRGGDIH